MEINHNRILIEGEILRIASLEQEWYEDIKDPKTLINEVRRIEPRADILTFWQRLPDTEPKYSYSMETDSIAALPIKSYSFWWDTQIDCKTRNMVRKSQKKGVTVRMVSFDD